MDDMERLILEMVLRVNNFGVENSAMIAANTIAAAKFAVIETFADQLIAMGELRTTAAQTKCSKTVQRKMYRGEVKTDLSLMAKTATAIKKVNPDFDNVFKVPHDNLNDATLLETARAFHTAASLPAVKKLFTGFALENDFLEDLAADTAGFEAAISEQDTANRARVGANADIDGMLPEVLQAVSVLKVVVPNMFRNDRAKLAEWTSASHVEKASAKPKTPAAPPV